VSNVRSMIDSAKFKMYDSLQNLLTGLGVDGFDKSVGSKFFDMKLTDRELEDAYSSDWLVAKVCNLPPFDMTREWRTMNGSMDANQLQKWHAMECKLNLRAKFKEAMTWGRVYGGAGIVISVDDGHKHEPWLPLDINNIKQNSLSFLIVTDKQYLHVGNIDNDPFSENYGYPDTYRMAPSSVEIHHTRIVRFEGLALPLQARRRNRYWGKSIVEALYSALLRAAEVQESIGTLIHESTVDIIRIPDLMQMLSNAETEAQLVKRFGVAKMQKSVNRMLLMDKEEEYEQVSQTFTGLTDIIEKYLSIVGGAADIPITRLLGSSPAGMNSTGDSDIRNYYDMLSARQEVDLRPKLEYLDNIIYRSLFGSEPEHNSLTFEFNPLWQMSEQEKADLQMARSTRDTAYLADNIVNEAIVARDLMENNVYSGVDSEYVEEMEKFLKESDEDFEEPANETGGTDANN